MSANQGPSSPFGRPTRLDERAEAPLPGEAAEALEVEKILRGKKCVNLLHRGQVYRLQVTKQGRLLLTK